jgi:hypothetical protein
MYKTFYLFVLSNNLCYTLLTPSRTASLSKKSEKFLGYGKVYLSHKLLKKLDQKCCATLGSKNMQMFTYKELLTSFRKGLRNGNWRKLSRLEKALYMASLWYSRHQRAIINEILVGKLSLLVEKLKETKGARVFKRGFEKAVELLSKGEGIFAWAPSFRDWLKNPDYVFWLGAGGLRIST